ncbi:MAG: hypothetical protein ACKOI0_05125 [Actinomycetota bacterium]
MAHTCTLPETASPQSLYVCPECGATWEAALQNGIFDFEIQAATVSARWLLVEAAPPARLLAG